MRRKIIPYNPQLKAVARKLRKQGILSEVLLWQQLKGRQMIGHDFHRQKPIDNYIVDFFCHELMLTIEIDGGSHNDKSQEDMNRQQRLNDLGITVLRFYDHDVRLNLDGVVIAIRKWTEEYTPLVPLSRGE